MGGIGAPKDRTDDFCPFRAGLFHRFSVSRKGALGCVPDKLRIIGDTVLSSELEHPALLVPIVGKLKSQNAGGGTDLRSQGLTLNIRVDSMLALSQPSSSEDRSSEDGAVRARSRLGG